MDFTEDFEVNSPCLVIQSSQLENSQKLCRSDTDPYLLKQLNISRSTEPLSSKASFKNENDSTILASEELDSRFIQDTTTGLKLHIAVRSGGNGGKDGQNKPENQGNNNDSSSLRHVQTCPPLDGGVGGGGGGAGAGGDDSGDGNSESHHEPSTCNEDTSHSEPTASSSDSFPELIPANMAASRLQTSGGSEGAVEEGDTISQASTAIVGKSSSSSSSSGGNKSDSTNSSCYQASISSIPSSLSSESSHAVSSGTPYFPLLPVMRTQSEFDVSSSSNCGENRGGITHQKSAGFRQLDSVKEGVDKQDQSTSDSSKDQVEQECSSQEDLFGLNKEDSNAISSQEVSRLSTPQDRSTPVEQKVNQDKSSLYRHVLTDIQTSTPVESTPGIQQTPPNQNITSNQSFQCFQFSGEVVVKDSSVSSSSGVVNTSPLPNVPMIVPSSPTSPTRSEQTSSKSSSRSGQSSSSLEEQSASGKSTCQKESSESSVEQIPPSPNTFGAWRTDSINPSPEEEISASLDQNHCSKKNKHYADNDDEEFVGLPRWQQELLQKNEREQPTSSTSSSSKTPSCNSSLEKENYDKKGTQNVMQQPAQHSWQSEVSSTVELEGKKTSFLSKKHVKHVTFLMDVSESQSSERFKNKTESTSDIIPSLSPSSIDGQEALTKAVESTHKETVRTSEEPGLGTTCTQPELSEDLFRPSLSSTQESTQPKDQNLHDIKPTDIQRNELEEPDVISQDESVEFDLHFSQSQSELDSPPLIPEPPSSPVAITAPSTAPCDQAILSSTSLLRKGDSERLSSPEPRGSSTSTVPCSTASTLIISDQVVLPLSTLLKKQDSNSAPSQSILAPVRENIHEGYSSLQQRDVSGLTEGDVPKDSESATIPKSLTLRKKDDEDASRLAAEKADDTSGNFELDDDTASKPTVPPLLSDTSTDSITGMGFHFSLPTSTEPLRPVTCTTPPPMRSREPVVPSTVCETPGIFTQESIITSTAKARQHTTPSLTFSMPRESESESEIFFQMQQPDHQSTSSSSTTDPLESSRTPKQSVFSRSRGEAHGSRRREHHKDDEYNPFEFTSQDDIPNNPQINWRKPRKREHDRYRSKQGDASDSDAQATKIGRGDTQREPYYNERECTSEEEKRADGCRRSPLVRSAVDPSNDCFHKVTKTRTIKTITTVIERHITITTTKKDSDNIIDNVTYTERENPRTEVIQDVQTDETDFIQRDNSTYEIVRSPQTRAAVESTTRSPRGKKRSKENIEELYSGRLKKQKTTSKSELASKEVSGAVGRTESTSHKMDSPRQRGNHDKSPPLLRRESTEKVRRTTSKSELASKEVSGAVGRTESTSHKKGSPRKRGNHDKSPPLLRRESTEKVRRTTSKSELASKDVSGAVGRTESTSHKEDSPRKSGNHDKSPPLLRRESTEKVRRTTTKSELASKDVSGAVGRTESTSHKKDSPRKRGNHDKSPPLLRRESTEKVIQDEGTSRTTPEPALHFTPGTRVFAHWSDNHFYPGVLTSGPSKAGLYNVAFDDGDRRKVRSERLILRDSLHVGQRVLAQDTDGYYDPGVIVGHYCSGPEIGYEIKDSKKNIKRYPVKNVILTEEQAAAILSSSSSSLSRSTSGSSVSVRGLNIRSTSTKSNDASISRSSSSNVSSGGLNSRSSRDTSAKDTSCSSNDLRISRSASATKSPLAARPAEHRNDDDETPKSSRKKSKVMKNRKALSWRGTQGTTSSSEASSDEPRDRKTRGKRGARRQLGKILNLPTRTSPRKQKLTPQKEKANDNDDEPSTEENLPSDDSLFAGFAFLITGCDNIKDKDPNDDSPDSANEFLTFDRQQIVRQIETGGGVVLKDFEETQTSGADQCFLISNSHQRTQKFFQCLAYNIPIVHHSWIHDSAILSKLQDYKKYLLPAGVSLETGEVMECETEPRPKVLQGLKIYLHGTQDFKNTWSSVVLAAGCFVVTKLPNRPGRAAQLDDLDTMCDVIISGNNTLPASIRHTVEILGIPVVALEWLFQCLINGFLVPYDNHPKYDYKNIQKDDNNL